MTSTTPINEIEVDIIIPVHNAATTIQEAVKSALHQEWPDDDQDGAIKNGKSSFSREHYSISITVCCYDDGSTDNSLEILKRMQEEHSLNKTTASQRIISSRLLVESSVNGVARGAGYARNRAIQMNNPPPTQQPKCKSDDITDYNNNDNNKYCKKFLCLLDSDDTMHPQRVALQTRYMMTQLDPETRQRTLLGCTFARDPPNSTWHYSQWANSLSDERLLLEQYREITILQPTWFLPYTVWARVGGYVEAPSPDSGETVGHVIRQHHASNDNRPLRLIHPLFDTPQSLRLAEDLRFFHAHMQCPGATIRLLRTEIPLVMYRYVGDNQSQSFRTSRKLLLQLRVLAFERRVLERQWLKKKFVIWGAGRDGKDFYKSLDAEHQRNVYCFVDVDAKKLSAGFYVPERGGKNGNDRVSTRKIPIVHFSFLVPDQTVREAVQEAWERNGGKHDPKYGGIDKSQNKTNSPTEEGPQKKKQKQNFARNDCKLFVRGLDQQLLQTLPVVVCVAMYRTNGVLEKNVASIGRKEGENLWHFS